MKYSRRIKGSTKKKKQRNVLTICGFVGYLFQMTLVLLFKIVHIIVHINWKHEAGIQCFPIFIMLWIRTTTPRFRTTTPINSWMCFDTVRPSDITSSRCSISKSTKKIIFLSLFPWTSVWMQRRDAKLLAGGHIPPDAIPRTGVHFCLLHPLLKKLQTLSSS